MGKKIKKTKQERYADTMTTLGIDINEYKDWHHQPESVVYKIYCEYRLTMDRMKYPWEKLVLYAEDLYESKSECRAATLKLENKYPDWIFLPKMSFVRGASGESGMDLPKRVILDLEKESLAIKTKYDINKQKSK